MTEPLVNVPVESDPKDGLLVNAPPDVDNSLEGYSPEKPAGIDGPLVTPNDGPAGVTVVFAVPAGDREAINTGLNGVMGGAPTVVRPGSTEISEYPTGTQADAEQVFDNLPLSGVKPITSPLGAWGRTGKLPDGTTVIVRPSQDGRPTIEVVDYNRPGGKRVVQEIRFGSKR